MDSISKQASEIIKSEPWKSRLTIATAYKHMVEECDKWGNALSSGDDIYALARKKGELEKAFSSITTFDDLIEVVSTGDKRTEDGIEVLREAFSKILDDFKHATKRCATAHEAMNNSSLPLKASAVAVAFTARDASRAAEKLKSSAEANFENKDPTIFLDVLFGYGTYAQFSDELAKTDDRYADEPYFFLRNPSFERELGFGTHSDGAYTYSEKYLRDYCLRL